MEGERQGKCQCQFIGRRERVQRQGKLMPCLLPRSRQEARKEGGGRKGGRAHTLTNSVRPGQRHHMAKMRFRKAIARSSWAMMLEGGREGGR